MSLTHWLEQQGQAVIFAKNLAGLTACSQQLTLSNGQKYVYHQQSARATRLGVNYQDEAKILSHLASQPFTPRLYYNDCASNVLEWIEGDSPQCYSDALLAQLAQCLVQLHQSPLAPKLPVLDLNARCQQLWQNLNKKQKQQIPQPKALTITPFAQAICHHDLHLGNFILRDKTLMLIDWEYSAVSDPALEFALFFAGNSLSDAQKQYILTIYLQEMPFDEVAFKQKMAEYQSAISMLNQLWTVLSTTI